MICTHHLPSFSPYPGSLESMERYAKFVQNNAELVRLMEGLINTLVFFLPSRYLSLCILVICMCIHVYLMGAYLTVLRKME